MTSIPENNQPGHPSQAEFQELLRERLHLAIRVTLTTILEDEVTTFISADLYARSATRRDQRNGYYTRDWVTTAGQVAALPVPRTRQGFRTQVFERYHR